ncbi:hypothetical protein GCM10011385_18580 [Nitratireductor aestuarii]|uniref:Uncharacterized protein n=1 Tax=Nitratireductor aestuarii TaxID=1735103 RepID=A0A916RS94_9HYPH|nr:EscF/YscF/HrpA family type III secretion system needle major subunit [Nitratireductor aestuarii]GGA65056.1 hypothetical protein GCM10011385_18580 [Nitratireductor aestuarii]
MAINPLATPGSSLSRAGNLPADDGGLDVVTIGNKLAGVGVETKTELDALLNNTNMPESERTLRAQMLVQTWTMALNMRTNMVKAVADTIKAIIRNIA